jgi:hypothetical protein
MDTNDSTPTAIGSRVGRILRTLAINVVVLASLLTFVNVAAVGSFRFRAWLAESGFYNPVDSRARLTNYAGETWAETHFVELGEVDLPYAPFVGWMAEPYSGTTINIGEDGSRVVLRADGARVDTVVFLGGSAMWGTGATDDLTIPSHFVLTQDRYAAVNLGTSSYVARQGFARLVSHLDVGHAIDLAVTYDGVNDVYVRCQAGVEATAHARSAQIRGRMRIGGHPSPYNPRSWPSILLPTVALLDRVGLASGTEPRVGAGAMDCDSDPVKAARVARFILLAWEQSRVIVEARGGRFVAILQPSAFLGSPEVAHLDLDRDGVLGAQFRAVYSELRRLIGTAEFDDLRAGFTDMTDVFDVGAEVYIDMTHVSPEGNRIVAQALAVALDRPVGD